jgi:type III pantothenate kinase
MLFAIDIGNTNLTLGMFNGADLIMRWRMATNRSSMPDEYGMQFWFLFDHNGINPDLIDGICLTSVVPQVTSRVEDALDYYLKKPILKVSNELNLSMKIEIDQPSELGNDRIADAVAVKHLYGSPSCLIDFGTATTFNLINREGSYIGGAISAGIQTSADALFSKTAQLPNINIQKPPHVIGKNTIQSMQSGLFYGYISMVEGMVARYKRELGTDMKVVATGGLAKILSAETDTIDFVDSWLTMTGLRLIWEMNQV